MHTHKNPLGAALKFTKKKQNIIPIIKRKNNQKGLRTCSSFCTGLFHLKDNLSLNRAQNITRQRLNKHKYVKPIINWSSNKNVTSTDDDDINGGFV